MKSVNIGSTLDFGFLSEAIAAAQSTKSARRDATGSTSHRISDEQPYDCIGAKSITIDEIAFNGLAEARNQGEQQEKQQDQNSVESLQKICSPIANETDDGGTKGFANENIAHNNVVNVGGTSRNNEDAVNSGNEDCSQIKESYDEIVGKQKKIEISAGITTLQKPGDTAAEELFKVGKMSENDALQKAGEKVVVANHNDASTVHLSTINVGVDPVHCKPLDQCSASNHQIQAHADNGQEDFIPAIYDNQPGSLTNQLGERVKAKEILSAVSTSLERPTQVSEGLEFKFTPYRPPPLLRNGLNIDNLPMEKSHKTNTIAHIDPHPVGLGHGSDPNQKTQLVRSWARSCQERPSEPIDIAHTKPKSGSVKISIPFDKDIRQEGEALWRGWIVGYSIEQKLPYTLVNNSAERLWGKYGLVDVLTKDNGFFLFKFNNAKGSEFVLDGGPWHMGGKFIVVRPWEPILKLEKVQLNNIPIWVKFFNVPLECWTEKGLNLIASAIGRPIKLDEQTASRSRIAYARVCVEVSCKDTLPDSFVLDFEEGQKFDIRVEYPWKPLKCDKCKVFGHSCGKERRKTEREEWNQLDQKQESTRGKFNEVWREVDTKRDHKSISQMSFLHEMKKEGVMSAIRKEEIKGKGKVAFSKGGEIRRNNNMSFPSDLAIAKDDGDHAQGRPNLRQSDATTSVGPCYARVRPLKLSKD